MLDRLPHGGRVRRDGAIVEVPIAWKSMDVPFREGVRPAVTIPWGDVATAYHSTGILNIEVYLAMTARQIGWLRRMRPVVRLAGRPLPQALLKRAIRRFIAGPTPEQRRNSHGSFWGRVTRPDGRSIEATLVTPNGYDLTVATALACLEQTLQKDAPRGFCTPSKAFGAEFILSIPETDVRWEKV
jgi:short subunit dehydrogenase-like uncharacterized protein